MADARRKLAAILAADVVGYSRLMGADERATMNQLDACRAVFRRHIADHDGRVVDTAGDSVLAVFDSVVETVECAAAIQAELAARNAGQPDDRQMRFRIGINLGDVLEQADGTLYGDGVNVAARLESLAEPGGICLSGTAYDQVDGKTDLRFAFLGEQEVKNIARKVRAYRAEPATTQAAPAPAEKAPDSGEARRPSIAVLPFDNLSGDAEQEYFADGIAEDLITELSRLRWLTVIARNSTFTYKGQAVDVMQVGRDLNVRYVLEGSVRRGGERVRITAQLIDTASGGHIWAERYDRDITDIFAVQDEITETLVATLQGELGVVERERAHRKSPESLDAWETYQRGMWHCWRLTGEDCKQAEQLLQRACEMDAGFAPARAGLGYVQYASVFLGWCDGDRLETLDRALDNASQAVALDNRDALAHLAVGRIRMLLGDFDDAIAEIDRSIALLPSSAQAHFGRGLAMLFSNQPEAAIASVEKAMEFSPHDPLLTYFYNVRGAANLSLGNFAAAIDDSRTSLRHSASSYWPYSLLAAALAASGEKAEAAKVVETLYEKFPAFTPVGAILDAAPLKPQAIIAAWQWWVHGLREAGIDIPEESLRFE